MSNSESFLLILEAADFHDADDVELRTALIVALRKLGVEEVVGRRSNARKSRARCPFAVAGARPRPPRDLRAARRQPGAFLQ
jgi:hypothetical protein